MKRILYLFAISIMAFWSCSKIDDDNNVAVQSRPVSDYSSKLAQEWMQETYNTVRRQGLFALDGSRVYAYTAITMYESMVHGIPNGRSLAGQLYGLGNLPQPVIGKTYDWAIVMCHAVPQVLNAVVPSITTESRQRIDVVARAQEDLLKNDYNIPQDVIIESKKFGDDLAKAIIGWMNTDSRAGLEGLHYTLPSKSIYPQVWDGTTLGQSFMMPFWWTQRPFVINTYRICEPDAPYAYSTDPNSPYYKDVLEVYNATNDPEKVKIGQFWANNPSQSGTPAGSWIGIANQLIDQRKISLEEALRMYVLLGIGTRDGFIACWYMKYKYYLQRPVTYVREVLNQPTWVSPVPTPPYPDYTSGTSTNAGASSTILTSLFGNVPFFDGQHQDKGFGIRSFRSFREAGIEAYHSRIFAGVHMRRACEKGFEQGECIAQYILGTLQFKR